METKPKVSLVIPCHNEAEGLGSLLEEISAGGIKSLLHEVIVVDNGSTDGTSQVALKYGARVVYEPKLGYGQAMLRGLQQVEGDVTIAMDGDGSYPPSAIRNLLGAVETAGGESFFISGNRLRAEGIEKSMLLLNRVVNWFVSFLWSILLGEKIVDTQSGMWCACKRIIDYLDGIDLQMAFAQEIKIKAIHAGFKFLEIPIGYRPRLGKRKFRYVQDSLIIVKSIIKGCYEAK